MPYFDHNATTPLLPAAREAWLSAADATWQNPGSPYRSAARAHRLLEENRARLAAFFDSPAESIVFNSGATEANNAILAWVAGALPEGSDAIVSSTEHPSVLEAARKCFGGSRSRLRVMAVGPDGRIDRNQLEAALQERTTGFVAVMAANNETGVLGEPESIGELCRARGGWHLCDASQWIGKMPGRVLPRNSFLVGCAHKFGGPKGVGFIRLPDGAEGFRGLVGGAHEHAHRAGTENLAAIAAMVAALEHAEQHADKDRRTRAEWRDACAAAVTQAIPGAVVHGAAAGAGSERLWNTLSVGLPRFQNTRWVARLDRLGFEVSTGSACATGSDAPSHVLAAMGVDAGHARRTIRISSGWATTRSEWEKLADAMVEVWRGLSEEDSGAGGGVIEV